MADRATVEEPDWYPDWRHEAVHELQDKNARLSNEYGLSGWERFDYDLQAGTMIFSDRGVPKVIVEIQIAGSTSKKAGNWLWAWGNSHWPEGCVNDSRLVKAFGEKHGICELTHDYVDIDDDLNGVGWALTAAMARITGALGAYRPPRDEGGGLYLVYRSASWAS